MADLADLTADDCERVFRAALTNHDMRGVDAALHLLALRDPRRAEVLVDTLHLGLDLAVAERQTRED